MRATRSRTMKSEDVKGEENENNETTTIPKKKKG